MQEYFGPDLESDPGTFKGEATMTTIQTKTESAQRKSFKSPDETRPFKGKGKLELVKFGDTPIGRATFEPGWRWSEHVKPIAQTDSCQTNHLGYVLQGRMHVKHNDGTEIEVGPGDAFVVVPGHDAWVVGSEACIALDVNPSILGYAKPK